MAVRARRWGVFSPHQLSGPFHQDQSYHRSIFAPLDGRAHLQGRETGRMKAAPAVVEHPGA